MMLIADHVAERAARLRHAGLVPTAVRGVIVVAAAASVWTLAMAPWHRGDLIFLTAIAAAIGSVLMPGSTAPLTLTGAVMCAWLLRADGDVDGWLAGAVTSLLVVHMACAFAASMPLLAQADAALLRPWIVATAVIALGTLAVAGGLGVLAGADLAGAFVMTLAPLVGLGALALWWAR